MEKQQQSEIQISRQQKEKADRIRLLIDKFRRNTEKEKRGYGKEFFEF